jgi:chromosome segregation ATPase
VTLEEQRAAKQKLQDETRDELETIRTKKQNLLLERAQLVLDYTIALEKSMQIQEEIAEIEVQKIEAESELEHLEGESHQIRQMLDQRRAEITEYERQIKTKTDECKRLIHKINEIQGLINASEDAEDIRIILNRWCENEDLDTGEPLGEDQDPRTLDHLDAEVSTTKGRLELLRVGNPLALEQYEDRARKIEQLKRKIESFEVDLEALSQEIQAIQEQWEPKLEEMVANISEAFSHNFERIGCAGQVSVRKHENDFKLWAIEIMVKFRFVIPGPICAPLLTSSQRERGASSS